MRYEAFLDRAGAALGLQGAHVLVSRDAAGPEWARGWDEILAGEGPGAATIYAFTRADGSLDIVGERVDLLAQGLARSGMLSQPVSLVTIATFPSGADRSVRRSALRLTPSSYYPGLRPHSWVVDLPAGQVLTPRFGQPEGKEALIDAINPSAAAMPADEVARARDEHGRQLDAFRALMLGRQPWVTYGLIAVNVLMFLLLYTGGGPDNETALKSLGALQPRLIEDGQWWRLFTSMFLHASIPHILFNMTSLFAVGSLAERLYGSVKMLAIYLGAGIIGSMTSLAAMLAAGNLDVVGVGASGAIFGVAGALVAVRFHPSDVIPRRLRDRVSASILPLVLLSLGLAYITPGVDNAAHIGGLLSGTALSFVFPLTRQAPTTASGRS